MPKRLHQLLLAICCLLLVTSQANAGNHTTTTVPTTASSSSITEFIVTQRSTNATSDIFFKRSNNATSDNVFSKRLGNLSDDYIFSKRYDNMTMLESSRNYHAVPYHGQPFKSHYRPQFNYRPQQSQRPKTKHTNHRLATSSSDKITVGSPLTIVVHSNPHQVPSTKQKEPMRQLLPPPTIPSPSQTLEISHPAPQASKQTSTPSRSYHQPLKFNSGSSSQAYVPALVIPDSAYHSDGQDLLPASTVGMVQSMARNLLMQADVMNQLLPLVQQITANLPDVLKAKQVQDQTSSSSSRAPSIPSIPLPPKNTHLGPTYMKTSVEQHFSSDHSHFSNDQNFNKPSTEHHFNNDQNFNKPSTEHHFNNDQHFNKPSVEHHFNKPSSEHNFNNNDQHFNKPNVEHHVSNDQHFNKPDVDHHFNNDQHFNKPFEHHFNGRPHESNINPFNDREHRFNTIQHQNNHGDHQASGSTGPQYQTTSHPQIFYPSPSHQPGPPYDHPYRPVIRGLIGMAPFMGNFDYHSRPSEQRPSQPVVHVHHTPTNPVIRLSLPIKVEPYPVRNHEERPNLVEVTTERYREKEPHVQKEVVVIKNSGDRDHSLAGSFQSSILPLVLQLAKMKQSQNSRPEGPTIIKFVELQDQRPSKPQPTVIEVVEVKNNQPRVIQIHNHPAESRPQPKPAEKPPLERFKNFKVLEMSEGHQERERPTQTGAEAIWGSPSTEKSPKVEAMRLIQPPDITGENGPLVFGKNFNNDAILTGRELREALLTSNRFTGALLTGKNFANALLTPKDFNKEFDSDLYGGNRFLPSKEFSGPFLGREPEFPLEEKEPEMTPEMMSDLKEAVAKVMGSMRRPGRRPRPRVPVLPYSMLGVLREQGYQGVQSEEFYKYLGDKVNQMEMNGGQQEFMKDNPRPAASELFEKHPFQGGPNLQGAFEGGPNLGGPFGGNDDGPKPSASELLGAFGGGPNLESSFGGNEGGPNFQGSFGGGEGGPNVQGNFGGGGPNLQGFFGNNEGGGQNFQGAFGEGVLNVQGPFGGGGPNLQGPFGGGGSNVQGVFGSNGGIEGAASEEHHESEPMTEEDKMVVQKLRLGQTVHDIPFRMNLPGMDQFQTPHPMEQHALGSQPIPQHQMGPQHMSGPPINLSM